AMTMGDRVAVMDQGVLQQVASPTDLYNHPANAFVAGFIGSPPMNRMEATFRASGEDGQLASSGTYDITQLSDGLGAVARAAEGAPVVLGVRPEHLDLVGAGEGMPATVRLVEHLGSEQIVHVDAPGLALYN